MTSPQKIYEALETRRLELGLSQADVGSRAFGRYDNSAFQALRRGSSPSVEKLEALCRAVGWEFYFGPAKDRGPDPVMRATGEEFAPIPIHDATLSAGGGRENSVEALVGHLAFNRSWLRRIGVPVASAVLARAVGDSMTPTIHDGDMLLVDRSRNEPPVIARGPKDKRPASIFAIVDDGGARVKRIELAPGGMLALLSDNPAYAPDFRSPSSIHIVGRVVWWGHTNKDV